MSDKKTDKNSKEAPKSKYDIIEIKTAKHSIPLRKSMKEGLIPRFPFSMLLNGRSGSGKTNLLLNLLTRREFYGNYFPYTIVFSPTAGNSDDMYDVLKLPKENFKADFTEDDLKQIIESRKKMIEEKGIEHVAKNCRVLIIMDDIIADRSFLQSESALRAFALLRHYLCSILILSQSFTKIPRALRLNVNAIAIFPASASEVQILCDEVCPPSLKKREFENVIDYCTEGKFDFLYINNHADRDKRIRKNMDEIVNLDDFRETPKKVLNKYKLS